MTTRLMFAGILLCAALLGCTNLKPAIAPKASAACSNKECLLEIKVDDCSKEDGFSVSETDLHVFDPSRIEWRITTEGFRFREDVRGIEILWNGGVFDQPRPHGHKKFSWRDRHRDSPAFKSAESFYYYIHIEKDDGTDCARFDPWISNW